MAGQKNGDDDNRQWFLRINGETVFGPVSTQGLIVWAEQGRVLPGHEVSEDRKKWVQAVSLELLDMRWYVDDGDGDLRGPLNRLAAEVLIKSGKVADGAHLVPAEEVEDSPDTVSGGDESETEALRRRVRELESVVSDPFTERSGAGDLEAVRRERDALAASLKKAEAQKADVAENMGKAAHAHERDMEQTRKLIRKLEQQVEDAQAGCRRVPELEKAVQFHEHRAEETAQTLEAREAELEALREQLKMCGERAGQAEAARKNAETRLETLEAELTELLNNANARDITYQEKIAELEKMCAQPPEETARFFADQAAVYELINAEVVELASALEQEKAQAEQMRTWSTQRQQALQERRQKLLKHVGGSPGDMTRRATRDQIVDPQVARLRAELETLRVTYQREIRLAELKEREWQEKLRMQESGEMRLRSQVMLGEKKAQRVQELEELLRRREREAVAERKNREQEREQFEANQRALLMRIDTLEREARPSTPADLQSTEARNVKLASWMRLKR